MSSEILEWLKILAILFTGGWAVFLLIVLRHVATARVRLDKLRSDRDKAEQDVQKSKLEIQELDHKLKTQPVIRAKMKTSVQHKPSEGDWILFATIEIENTGNAPARLAYEKEDPFLVTKADFDKQGKPIFKKPTTLPVPQARDPKAPAVSTIVRAGGQESLPFAVHLKHPGLYLLSFRAKLHSADRASLKGLGIPGWRPVSWTAKHYVWVE
jgi:hypothetical protein